MEGPTRCSRHSRHHFIFCFMLLYYSYNEYFYYSILLKYLVFLRTWKQLLINLTTPYTTSYKRNTVNPNLGIRLLVEIPNNRIWQTTINIIKTRSRWRRHIVKHNTLVLNTSPPCCIVRDDLMMLVIWYIPLYHTRRCGHPLTRGLGLACHPPQARSLFESLAKHRRSGPYHEGPVMNKAPPIEDWLVRKFIAIADDISVRFTYCCRLTHVMISAVFPTWWCPTPTLPFLTAPSAEPAVSEHWVNIEWTLSERW